jgi:hypothetical protein
VVLEYISVVIELSVQMDPFLEVGGSKFLVLQGWQPDFNLGVMVLVSTYSRAYACTIMRVECVPRYEGVWGIRDVVPYNGTRMK